jgi:ABC-type dipeptide/oligopeptide/nickel transport system permease subunit
MTRTIEEPRDGNLSSESTYPSELEVQAAGAAVAEFERAPTPTSKETLRESLAHNQTYGVLRRMVRSPKGAVGMAILGLLVFVAIFGPYLVPHDPILINVKDQLQPPSATYWFGTDELGRDIFSRIVAGTRVSLQAGLLAVALAALVGVITGLLAGYMGGWFDTVIMRIWDTFLAFPAIFLAIGIVTILGPGQMNAMIAVAIISMPTFARLVRATTLSVKSQDYVHASRAIGSGNSRIMRKTIFPNCIAPKAIAAPAAILTEASLSYLGLGSQPPDPSWGNMIQSAQSYLHRAPTYGIFPGLAITFLVVGMNYFADGLQDAIDPRRSRAGASMQ